MGWAERRNKARQEEQTIEVGIKSEEAVGTPTITLGPPPEEPAEEVNNG